MTHNPTNQQSQSTCSWLSSINRCNDVERSWHADMSAPSDSNLRMHVTHCQHRLLRTHVTHCRSHLLKPNERSAGRDANTACWPKIFAPPQTPFPGAQDGQNLISWRWSLPSPTNPVWWRLMHAILSYRDNRPTHKQRPPARPPFANTQIGPITIHCAAKLSVQWN